MSSDIKVSIAVVVMEYQIQYLDKLIASIENQSHRNIEVVLIDKSKDGIVSNYIVGKNYNSAFNVIIFPQPGGFAENYNRAIRESSGEFIFVLNLDTYLEPDCIEKLIEAMAINKQIGCVSPKIIRMDEDFQVYNPKIFDSTGMYLTKYLRHHDRGAGEVDAGQFDDLCYVFGVTGAAAFFRKECLDDIKIEDQYYDENFWSYREDADLSWRLQNYGWVCLYQPEAVVNHVRTLKPGKRSLNSRKANMHSVKNRYLLLFNNISLTNYFKYFIFIFLRDIVVIGGVVIKEQYSLEAFYLLGKNFKQYLKKRKHNKLMSKADRCAFWFKHKEVSLTDKV